jgi:hypothetical protein
MLQVIGDLGQQCHGRADFSCFDPLNGKIADPNLLGQLFHTHPAILSDLPYPITYLHGAIVSKSEYLSSRKSILNILFAPPYVETEG